MSASTDERPGGRELSWWAFVPRDTVFIRDGRSFDASADVSATTVQPWPSTIAGAVLAAFASEPAAVCGPVLGRREGDAWAPWFPAPADLVRETDLDTPYAFRLRLAEIAGHTDLADDDSGAPPTSWLVPPDEAVGKVEPLTGWLAGEWLADYLAGSAPASTGTAVGELELCDPLHREPRVGLAREVLNRRVKTGFLYQATHLRPEDGWAFLAGCQPGEEWSQAPTSPVPLGGRGRLVDVEPALGVRWPDRPLGFPGGRVLVYLATPALWPAGWRMPLPPGARLVAAAVGDPEAVATTSPRLGWREHRALRWAAPAGSVYLLRFDDEGRAAAWAAEAHGTAYGREKSNRLRTAGFGVVLTGVWT